MFRYNPETSWHGVENKTTTMPESITADIKDQNESDHILINRKNSNK
jgi:hypothetical protein